MSRESRIVCYDKDLRLEAYRFKGIMQAFPNHFHDYYVIGFIEKGLRRLTCQGVDYHLGPGDLLLFHPGMPHACNQVDGKTLDYRCINIRPGVMEDAVEEITGVRQQPRFLQPVLSRSELAPVLRELHGMILEDSADFRKEELFLLLMDQLLRDHCQQRSQAPPEEPADQVQAVCRYLEEHYGENIRLEQLSGLTGLSKYHLLRSFTRQKGISPYRYLETIRIGNAKKLLEQGVVPAEVAMATGFSDQSHFTNFFKRLIGLTPRQYMRIFQGDSAMEEPVKTDHTDKEGAI